MTTTSAAFESSSACHALPCSIDYTGKAPSSLYFLPHEIPTSSDNDEEGETKMLAAQFRGRGLLSVKPKPLSSVGFASSSSSTTPPNSDDDDGCQLQGCLFQVQNDGATLAVQAKFGALAEWHHEHDVKAVQLQQRAAALRGSAASRVARAQQWSQVAATLHQPLEVLEE